eukprot:scaffold5416_cov79-Cyclotella_meneghiniana.AAC.1
MMARCDVTFLVRRHHLKLTHTPTKNSHEGACADTAKWNLSVSVNLEESIHSKSRQVKCERCTDSSSSAHISSPKELTDTIEMTWHRHLELRNELYELEMGPSDVLEHQHLQLKTMYYELKG